MYIVYETTSGTIIAYQYQMLQSTHKTSAFLYPSSVHLAFSWVVSKFHSHGVHVYAVTLL